MKKNNIVKKENIYNFLQLLPYLWLATGLFLYKNSDKGMVIMMIVAVIASFISQGLAPVKKKIIDSKILWVIFIMTAYALFSYFYHGGSSREIRALIALSIFLPFFPRSLLTKKTLIILTIIGSMACFISAVYYSVILELNRARWPINAIPFATIAATFSLLSVNYLTNLESNSKKIILLFSLLLSIAALVLSQSRGVWLAFIVSMVITIILLIKDNKTFFNYKVVLGGLTLLLIAIMIFSPIIEKRWLETQYQIEHISSGNSIGLRLQMLSVTPDMVKGDLLIGSGNNQLEKLNKLYTLGKIPKALYNYQPPHYHNQYADKLIKNGLIGLILFLLLLITPLVEARHVSSLNRNIIIGIVLLFSISAITDAPFNHGQTIFIFVLLLYGLTQKTHNDENIIP